MTATAITLVALAFSAAPIILLCIGDPKRRRSVENKNEGMTKGLRRRLAAIAVVPGIFCAASGDSAAFLSWLGGCALIGWGAAYCFHIGEHDVPRSGSTR